MAVLCYAQPLKNGICTASEYFLKLPFLSRLYELYLSLKDLEIYDEFKLLQNLHLYTQTFVCPQAQDLLEKLAEIFLYNFNREHIFLKLKTKKLLRKIKSKNLTAGFQLVSAI